MTTAQADKMIRSHRIDLDLVPWHLIGKNLDIQPDGCWEWRGSTNGTGYGRVRNYAIGKNFYVHRIIYTDLRGPIPDGMTLDHLCRNPRCANPDHLEVVTMRENILRSNGLSARRARQTHCLRGHEFTPENTEVRPKTGQRHCIVCRNAAGRARYHRARGMTA